ncbi:phosphotransferase [Nakamurella sp. YIM 132087]|uniref:Phosphotransferase n=1 Tax=Nakamurella alba TaxID=2665158 RepID=A0A7K1FED3_9ACTN|nr:phosphotransferase family protein [Nakamurella alba]MTD12458.1 phosphotransferase [Nakamurella alba]
MSDADLDMVTARAAAAAARRWSGAIVGDLRPLPGGVSSLTYAARLTVDGIDRSIVVKMAPPGFPPVRNRDVLRQARVLDQLAVTGALPVPAVLFHDDGNPPMFGMEFAEGQSYEPLLDVSQAPPEPGVVRARAFAAARALGRLHAADPAVVSPAGEPTLSIADELSRWSALLGTVPPDIAPGRDDLQNRLAGRLPDAIPSTLLHGDYRLANMLFNGPDLTAVIDWEIWSIGDPRTDLAWLLMHSDPAHRFHRTRPPADRWAGTGMPAADETLSAYLTEHPLAEISDLRWFLAYCHYKTASTIAVFVKRNRRREVPEAKLVVADEVLAGVVRRGLEILDGAVDPLGPVGAPHTMG